MRKNKFKLTAVMLGLLIPCADIMPLFAMNNNYNLRVDEFQSKLEFSDNLYYPQSVFQILLSSEKNVYEYTKTKDISYLKKSIDSFCSITTHIASEYDDKLYSDENLNKVHDMIRDEIYKMSNVDEQCDMVIYYAEKLFLGWRKNKELTTFRDGFFRVKFIRINTNAKAKARLDYLDEVAYYFSKYTDLDSDSDIIPDLDNYPPKDSVGNNGDTVLDTDNSGNNDNNNLPEVIPDNNDMNIVDTPITTDVESSFTEYIAKNNICYEVITNYKNGEVVSTKEVQVPISDFVKCDIYTYVHTTEDDLDIFIDDEYINSNQNEDSEQTIHYTVNKNLKNPRYFNTGIRADASNASVTYNQLKDALYQLCIKAEGFSVTGNNKFLSIIDGRPVVLSKSVETYSKGAVERLLDSYTNVGLKILKPAESNSNSLENYLSNAQIKEFSFNGVVTKLDKPFLLSGKQVYAPTEELMSKLDIKSSLSGDTITLTKDSTVVKVKVNSKSYYVNNTENVLSTSPMMHNSVIYSPIDSILREFGYELIWDVESTNLIIDKI